MKYVKFLTHFSFVGLLVLSLFLASCKKQDKSDPLCAAAPCGTVDPNSVNVTIFNASSVDFTFFSFDIGGHKDSVDFLPAQQHSCWFFVDTVVTKYFVATARTTDNMLKMDTIFLGNSSVDTLTSGNYMFSVDVDQEEHQLKGDWRKWTGECQDIFQN